MTENQVRLLSWIRWYEAIYALDDVRRPPEEVIEDDERLDVWWADERARIEKELRDYYYSLKHGKPQTKEPPMAQVIG